MQNNNNTNSPEMEVLDSLLKKLEEAKIEKADFQLLRKKKVNKLKANIKKQNIGVEVSEKEKTIKAIKQKAIDKGIRPEYLEDLGESSQKIKDNTEIVKRFFNGIANDSNIDPNNKAYYRQYGDKLAIYSESYILSSSKDAGEKRRNFLAFLTAINGAVGCYQIIKDIDPKFTDQITAMVDGLSEKDTDLAYNFVVNLAQSFESYEKGKEAKNIYASLPSQLRENLKKAFEGEEANLKILQIKPESEPVKPIEKLKQLGAVSYTKEADKRHRENENKEI